jgi:hypothetical protein
MSKFRLDDDHQILDVDWQHKNSIYMILLKLLISAGTQCMCRVKDGRCWRYGFLVLSYDKLGYSFL